MDKKELCMRVQNEHIAIQQELMGLLRRVTAEHDFKALAYDETSKIIHKLFDVLEMVESELQKED